MDRYWLLTSTTYGTWLPGDSRGFVSNVADETGRGVRHNERGTPCDSNLPALRAYMRRQMIGDRDFLRDGCLVMILAMAWDQIDGSGASIQSHIPACREALARLTCEGEDAEKLVRTVRMALDVADQGGPETPELQELSHWVHKRFVRGYFRHVAEEFERNPYFRD